jgi:uncharacterized protein YuzE
MRFTYDPEAKMAYIQLGEAFPGVVDYSVELWSDDHDPPITLAVAIDHNGHIFGIEIGAADRALSPEVQERAERPTGDPFS